MITIQIVHFGLILVNGIKCSNWINIIQASHLENNSVNDDDQGEDNKAVNSADEGEDNKVVNDAKLEHKCIFAIQDQKYKNHNLLLLSFM